MRTIYCLLVVLAVLGWFAAGVEVAAPTPPQTGKWRRTANGWEVSTQWYPSPKAARPRVHPVVVGSLQLLLSTWAVLIAQPRLCSQYAVRAESPETDDEEIRRSFK